MATAAPPQADAPPDPKSYYGYLIADDKTPTPLFAAFLRALAQHIIDNVGDTSDKQLSPPKLAAFYKLAGYDYDALFLEQPNPSISFTWQNTGCQHSLQPTDDAFKPPSIPVLTTKGFISWQTLQTLLFPDVHVPVLQFAAKNWNLKHPDTGEPFPPDLPKEALPSVPDPKIEEWHLECGRRLRREAAAAEHAKEAKQASKPQPGSPRSTSVPRARARPSFKHTDYVYPRAPRDERSDSPRAPRARNPSPRPGMSSMDGADGRAYSYHHVPPHFTVPATAATAAGVFAAATAAAKFTRNVRLSPPADEHRTGRRRSFSDYPSPPTPAEPRVRVHSPHIHTETHNYAPRRHSQPHHHYKSSSDTSDSCEDELPPHVPPRGGRPFHIPVPRADDPPMPSVRRVVPPGPTVLPDPYPPGPMYTGKCESSSSGGDRDRRRRDERERERVPFPNVSRSPRRSPHRSPHRPEEPRRRSRGVSGNLQDKLSSILPNGVVGAISNMTKTERPRSSSRTHSHSSEQGSGAPRYSKESLQGSKLGREWSYDSDDGNAGSTNGDRHRHRDRDFERERERERERPRRDYDRDRDPRDAREPRDFREARDPRDRDARDYRRDREVPFRPRDKEAEYDRERDRDRHQDQDKYRGREFEHRERERDTYILDRGRRDSLREKKKNRSLDRSREHSHEAREPREPREEPERPDEDRDYRSRRDRDRERYPLRPDTLKRPVVSPEVER